MAPQTSPRRLSLVVPERVPPALNVKTQSRGKSLGRPFGDTSNGCQIRVLMVVSDRQNADWAIAELEKAGYDTRVDFALSRKEFGVLVGGLSYDVILAEFTLRGWTGMDVLSTVYDREIETPVIIINAAGNDERARGWIEAGAADYIIDANPKRLPLAVRRAIAESHALEERETQDELVKKLTMAVDKSPTSVMFTDLEGRIQYVNQRFSDLSGYTSDECIQLGIFGPAVARSQGAKAGGSSAPGSETLVRHTHRIRRFAKESSRTDTSFSKCWEDRRYRDRATRCCWC